MDRELDSRFSHLLLEQPKQESLWSLIFFTTPPGSCLLSLRQRESSDPHSINPRAQAVICAQVGVRNRAHPVQAFQEDPSCLVCRWISCPISQGPESNIRNLFSSLRETLGLPKALNVCSECSPRGNHCLPQSPCYQLREQGQLWAVRPASHSEKQLTKDRTE